MDPVRRDELYPAARIFCNPDILHFIQDNPHRPYPDSKSIVDLPLKRHPQHILSAFHSLSSSKTIHEYLAFIHWAFHLPHTHSLTSLKHPTPSDYTSHRPSFLTSIPSKHHPSFILFAHHLKQIWPSLCRSYTDVPDDPTALSSLIPLPHPFFVPGGRFNECYYWDSLWIVKGLIACDMLPSAQNVVRNLLHMVRRFGFVPNANRVYYLTRSQPPLLTESVHLIYTHLDTSTQKLRWLQEALPLLDAEHDWFIRTHSISQIHPKSSLASSSLSLYAVQTDHPRPESFKEDIDTLRRKLGHSNLEDPQVAPLKKALFRNLATGAESGWDYTSRWFPDPQATLCDIRVLDIIPCCLNSFLLRAEHHLETFHSILADAALQAHDQHPPSSPTTTDAAHHHVQAKRYSDLARSRRADMMRLMWHPARASWFDLDVSTSARTSVVSCAGLLPAWASSWGADGWTAADASAFVDFVLLQSGLCGPGGLACTTAESAEQWDSPNCWPPLVDLAIEGLENVARDFPDSGARDAARRIGACFLVSCRIGWDREGVMHEKYDFRAPDGRRGCGGEYRPQTGFGWTNGTVLWLLRKFWKDERFWVYVYDATSHALSANGDERCK